MHDNANGDLGIYNQWERGPSFLMQYTHILCVSFATLTTPLPPSFRLRYTNPPNYCPHPPPNGQHPSQIDTLP